MIPTSVPPRARWRWDRRRLKYGEINPRSVEHAGPRAKVILHIHDDHGSPGGINRYRIGPRGERHQPTCCVMIKLSDDFLLGGLVFGLVQYMMHGLAGRMILNGSTGV